MLIIVAPLFDMKKMVLDDIFTLFRWSVSSTRIPATWYREWADLSLGNKSTIVEVEHIFEVLRRTMRRGLTYWDRGSVEGWSWSISRPCSRLGESFATCTVRHCLFSVVGADGEAGNGWSRFVVYNDFCLFQIPDALWSQYLKFIGACGTDW
jgi:hypothetical protein